MKISTRKYIENCLYIKTKDSKLKLLNFNQPQNKIYNAINEMRLQGKPIRIVILKARQQGSSTITSAVIFKETVTKFNVNSSVMAHDIESTNKIFDMYKLFYQKLPQELTPAIKSNNAKILEFDNESGTGLKSQIRCMTAGTSGVGRGSTIHNLHISEFAFWSGDKWETFNGIMQAVPNTVDSMVIVESTANGFDEFQELWQKAVNGENDFKAVFIPWYELPEYRMNGQIELTEQERVLKEKYKLDNEQLNWRRWCIKNNCGGDLNKFRQEYPSSAEEAFITTGECYFNLEDIFNRASELQGVKPLKKGFFAYIKNTLPSGDIKINNVRFIEDDKGMVEIYQEPIKDLSYSLGADTAGEGSDRSVGQIINIKTLEQVGKISKEKITEDEYAEQLYCLGEYFNNCLIGVETNFNGYVLTLLQKMGYTNLYVRETIDKIYNTRTNSYGFKTTVATRPEMLAELRVIFKENTRVVNNLSTLDEMRTFVVNGSGKAEAMNGKHDDEVMALAIAYAIRGQVNYKPAQARFTSMRI